LTDEELNRNRYADETDLYDNFGNKIPRVFDPEDIENLVSAVAE